MKNNYSLTLKGAFLALMILVGIQSIAQTSTVFTDDFSSFTDQYYTINPGVIGDPVPNPKWKMARSGADFGSAIASRGLYLTNSGSAASNANGWVLASVLNSELSLPYSATLSANPGVVTWTFNMRQSRSNPNGFGTSGYGVAFILAGTNGTTNLTGTGYAVVLGQSYATDYIRLVRYNSGIRNFTTLVQSKTSGLTDFGSNYTSVKVTYDPSTNVWQLFLRNDGSVQAADPAVGTLTSQGSVANTTYVNNSLPLLGGYLNGGTVEGFSAYYKYINVDVGVPYISSIAPNSKVAGTAAFNLVVSGGNFINGVSKVMWNGVLRTSTFNSSSQLTAAITAADIATAGSAQVTVANGTTISNAEVFTIDSPGIPTLTTSASVVNLATTTTGTTSTLASYTISGINLTADPVISAPANFQISKDGTNFSDSLNLTRSGFNLTPQPTTIFVRTKLTAPPGIYSSILTNAVSGGMTKQVTIKAKVIASQPNLQSTVLTFTNVTSTSFKLNWTNGNGERRIIVMRAASGVNTLPVDELTYASSSVFGGGAELGTSNFVVYSGNSNNAVVTGLSAATTYYVSIFEYNGTISGTENYFTTSPLTGSQLTRNPATGWQIYAVNTVNTIDFDTTLDGVNTDSYQGAGLTPNEESGQLDSNAWAISGFSDGNVGFGGISPEDSDYDSGTSQGGVTEGGLYSFETSPNNFSLGVQPTGDDFTPGTITLRVQNQTAGPMTSLNIGYKVYIRNDQASSSTFNFSHSANNSSYTPVTAIDVASPGVADALPQWKAYYRVTTITGLNILSGNYYYLRWTAGDSGNVVYDEFALDDIVLVTNPTSNFVPFNNTAESFVVNGNAQLSGDLQVDSNLTISNNAKLNIGANTLSLKGTLINSTFNGIMGGVNSNLTINGNTNVSLSLDQTILGSTNLFNNLNIASSGTNTTTMLSPVVVNGTLTVASSQSLDLGTNVLTGTVTSAVINGTLMTKNTTALPLPNGKIWSGTGTVDYNSGTTAQSVVSGTYHSLTIRPTGGGVSSGNLTVNGVLNLPSANPSATVGSLNIGSSSTLTMGGSATNIGIGDVTGVILRNAIVPNVVYTFGHKDTSILFPNVGTLPTAMGLKIEIGTAPTWKTSAVKRIYDFKQTGGTGTKAVIKGHYLDSEVNGNNESRLVDYVNRTQAPIGVFEQGRSNYNTTENWIELTNADVAQAFYPNFDVVKLGFAETAVTFATWTGATNGSWNTSTNWSPATVPSLITAVVIPDANTTPNDPTFASGFEVLNVTIDSGGILYAGTDALFTVYGGAGAWLNNGTFNPGTGTSEVIFKNVDATIAGSTTFNNLKIDAGAGLRPLTNNVLSIAGTFTKTGTFTPASIKNTVIFAGNNQTVPALTVGTQGYNNLIISGTGALFPTSLRITGDFTLNNTVDFSGKTIEMTGVTPQTIGGTTAVLNNLTINNTNGGVSLVDSAMVNGTLTLTSGQLIIGNSNLTLGSTAVSGAPFSAAKMIVTDGVGEVRKPFSAPGSYFFPIGENTTPAYSPLTVNVTSGNFASAYVGISVKDGVHPNNYSIQNYLSRYWTVNQSGITNTVATVTGTYLAEDLSAAATTIAAAQLKGAFDQMTNPWLKFTPLSGTTLTAADVLLTNGQPSVFTGIKAAAFSVIVAGYGSFCKDEVVTLTAETVEGDGPYTYQWNNGLGTSATAVPPTATFGTLNYSVIVRDANGAVATNAADVTVLTPANAGSISASQALCKGSEPAAITLTGVTGDVLYWQKSTDPTFVLETTNISDITTVLQGVDAGSVLETTYFRAVISNGNCGVVYSPSSMVEIKSTTWDGTSWSNLAPDSTTSAIIAVAGNYTVPAGLVACSFTVESGNVIIPDGVTLTVNGAVFTSNGSIVVQNNGSLVQTNDLAQNMGSNVTVNRNTQKMVRYDFTYWSSPVQGQTLKNLSPITLFDKYYGWSSLNQNWVQYNYGNQTMQPGLGYSVRAPQNFTTLPANAIVYTAAFIGTPNNGVISVPVVGPDKFNLLGNPYPSALNADKFILDNISKLEGTLYFWTHNTLPASTNGIFYTYASTDYASYNYMGGTGTAAAASGTVGNNNNIPNGKIASGQGFFAKGKEDGLAYFDNSMRIEGNNTQFFKGTVNTNSEKHRLWLNISNTNASFRQILVGYTSNATTGYDNGWDGALMSNSLLTLYSFADNKKLGIQSLPLPFNQNNAVALGYQTDFSGSHRIAIDKFDGLFESQNVYLNDKLLQIVHDLKVTPYDFNSAVGTFDTRFEIVYVNSNLGTPNFDVQHQVYVYKEKESVVVKSPKVEMKSITITDMQGRLLQTIEAIHDFQVVLNLNYPHQVLLLSITTQDNRVITKKLLY